MANKSVGSSFDSFLEAEGIKQEVHNLAAKRVLAWQLEEAMKSAHVNKTEMAKRMDTSRAQLDRLLDPDNDKVQIDTIEKAARAVGKVLKLELVDAA